MEIPKKLPEEDPDMYQTGTTNPPKKNGGLIALLLVAVIFLGGIASALGVWNLQLFLRIKNSEKSPPLAFSATNAATEPDDREPSISTSHSDTKLSLHDSPEPVENIPQEGGLSLQEIYGRTIDSVVSIRCVTDQGSTTGTGVVLTANGYIVTNSHVVEDAISIQVFFSDEKRMEASMVGLDGVSDLAVLHVNSYNLTPAEFGDSDSIRVGDLAVAIGDPLGLELRGTMTDGIISAINRNISTGGRTMTLLQTNAALNEGNSGGPLINCFGQVIGINTMKIGDYMSASGVEGLGFAIPSTTVKEIVDQLISLGYVEGRPYLGVEVQEISTLFQQLYRLPKGVFISGVDQGSPADETGIRPGDVIIRFDGADIDSAEELYSQLYRHKAGDHVELVIYRNEKNYKVMLTIGQDD